MVHYCVLHASVVDNHFTVQHQCMTYAKHNKFVVIKRIKLYQYSAFLACKILQDIASVVSVINTQRY